MLIGDRVLLPAVERDDLPRLWESTIERDEIVRRLRAAGCVFAEDEAAVLLAAASSGADLHAMLDRRVRGAPLEQVVGWADFCGVRVAVDEGVFAPRPRTALLVREAARRLRASAVVVDLCCGCGAIGAALAARVPSIALYATDIDPAAVACARRNLAGATVYEGDLFAPLPPTIGGKVSMLTANVPYVPTAAIGLLPAEARRHESRHALDGGPDGLAVFRRVAAGAPRWLAPGGVVLMETSDAQVEAAETALRVAGLDAHTVRDPELDATVVIGTATG